MFEHLQGFDWLRWARDALMGGGPDDRQGAPTEPGQPPPAGKSQARCSSRSNAAFHLWIDGIGGYLVCTNNRVTLGQAVPDATVDVPLLADVSRLHATVTRDGDAYLLHALRATRVNGKVVETALLHHGNRLTLGGSCQLEFNQPVPVSTSARLDLVSGHRLRLAVDAVLLMADTLVLGPGHQVHVCMPDLKHPVILFRQGQSLGVRTAGSWAINGQSVRDRGLVEIGARVVGEDFSFALEAIP
jgi:FHA domain